jgi:protein-tyrosine phosphatase
MANSRYILLEFPSTAFPTQILSGILECTGAGKLPIIAHAERYDAFRHDPTLTEEALKLGARIQLNADSIMGKHGFFVKRFCHKLLKAEKVHFIASDAHDLRRRPPVLLPCYKRICKKYGEKYAKRIFWKNPRAILENKTL